MIDGYKSTVNTDQKLCAGEITYHWLLLKSGSVIYVTWNFFSIDLQAFINLFTLITRKFGLILRRQFFFFSVHLSSYTCFDLSYLECLSVSDSQKVVETNLLFSIIFCLGCKESQHYSLLFRQVVPSIHQPESLFDYSSLFLLLFFYEWN